MKYLYIKAIVLSVFSLYPLLGLVNEVSAHEVLENTKCSIETFKGTYTFHAQGGNVVDGEHPINQPTSYIGMLYFNGKGTGEGKYYYTGTSAAIAATSTYVIESNCHAKVILSNNKMFDCFVAPDGDSVQWTINTQGNLRVSGEAKRLTKSNLLEND